MKSLIKAFMGGGSGYAYLSLIAALAVFYVHYLGLQADRSRLKQALERAEQTAAAQSQTIQSQSRTAARRAGHDKEAEHAESQIRAAQDSRDCTDSHAVRTALGILRERADAAHNPD